MCGISGIINFDGQPVEPVLVNTMMDAMKHRGPDAYQQWGLDKKIELAHLRLSIIDLTSSSDQPFISSCQNFVIVFNSIVSFTVVNFCCSRAAGPDPCGSVH